MRAQLLRKNYSSRNLSSIRSGPITSDDLQSTENCLPLTLGVIVDLQHKVLQQLHRLALHLEVEGYITLLLCNVLTLSSRNAKSVF